MIGIRIRIKSDFGIIRETLTRQGICNQIEKVITPTCYIYHDKNENEYRLCHFKELLSYVDRKIMKLDEKDENRRNAIATQLHNWGMIEIIDPEIYQDELKEKIFVLKHSKRDDYYFNHKFNSFDKLP